MPLLFWMSFSEKGHGLTDTNNSTNDSNNANNERRRRRVRRGVDKSFCIEYLSVMHCLAPRLKISTQMYPRSSRFASLQKSFMYHSRIQKWALCCNMPAHSNDGIPSPRTHALLEESKAPASPAPSISQTPSMLNATQRAVEKEMQQCKRIQNH